MVPAPPIARRSSDPSPQDDDARETEEADSITRRRALHVAGATTIAALAGCSSLPIGSDEAAPEYTLHVESVDASPVEHALYSPADGALFGAPARTALDAVLPDGRHTTYGYEPLPSDAYVDHEGTYYRLASVVTGRRRLERPLVRVDPVSDPPPDAAVIDSLPRPSARALKILHTYTQTDGETSTADLLRGDAYVLRRPAELESRLATGALDGRMVATTESGTWAYRVRVARERIVETAYTALAIPVASTRDAFRKVVFGSRIDAELAPGTLSDTVRTRLGRAIDRGTYAETTPLSSAFDTLLERLGLGAVDTAASGRLLWYDDALYRYALYVSDPS
ncbi:hypothetical protein [Haloplanus natans]|uniref:hypothetical protein n=1 Tax=Haloplanus natans TaxID=376171 RepID=UPI000677B98D|nr:hypothetical protein [Haloplanus natans]